MCEGTLWAHYRLWALREGFSRIAAKNFRARLRKQYGAKPAVTPSGHVLFPIVLRDEHVEREQIAKKPAAHQTTSLSDVRIVNDLQFRDDLLAAGTVVPRLVPTEVEDRALSDDLRRQREAGRAVSKKGLIVAFHGRRCRLAADDAETVV